MAAILVGLLIGGALALLLAPYPGRAFRARVQQALGRLNAEARGSERFGGGPDADPLQLLKSRFESALQAARDTYQREQTQLGADLARLQSRRLPPPG